MRAWLLMLLAGAAHARITDVLVFPGGAELQREAVVAAGATEAVFACLPARLELDSLRARGEGGVRVGELAVRTQTSDQVPACSGQPQLDAQIRQLQMQRADLQAERDALDLMLQVLRNTGDAKPNPAQVEATRRQALEALRQTLQLARKQEALDEQLKPLLAERQQRRNQVGQWHEVRVRIEAPSGGRVVLSHRTRFAGWQPVYRADLDSAARHVRLDRRAEVAQTTGETWDAVQLTLSTRQPQRETQPPVPDPWILSLQPRMEAALMEAPMPAAPPPARALMKLSGTAAAPVDAPLPSFETEFDVQYRVPGSTRLASGDERRSLSLERLTWPVTVLTQVVPAQQAQAYRVATLPRPEGFFPPGRLQLLRDGEIVGESVFAPGDRTEQVLGFGPDDRLRVQVEPEQRDGAEAGFVGSRRELTVTRRYRLENTGKQALVVQVLEPGPLSQHESIRVEAQYDPAPQPGERTDLPGVRQWRVALAPGQQQVLSARYKLSAPRDARVQGWP